MSTATDPAPETPDVDETVDEVEEAKPVSAWRTVVTSLEGRIGLTLAAIMLVIIALGPYLAPNPPNAIGVGEPFTGLGGDNLIGTDNLGRDVLSRFLSGGRTVLLVPLGAVTLALLIGGGLGMYGAYTRGRADAIITRLFDLLMSLPPLLLVLVLIAGFGTSMPVLIVTVALVFTPRMGRVIRGASQAVVTSDYVGAAQARGETTAAILVREVLPNAAAPVIADTALRLTYAIIFVATLNFLGLGVQPPSSDWGLMVSEARTFVAVAPWAVLAPAAGIAALSISFNLIADALTHHITRDTQRGVLPL